MGAQRSNRLLELRGGGDGGQAIQQRCNLGRLGSIRGAVDEAEHAGGEPADHHRHGFAALARGGAEAVAQMGKVDQGVPQQCVGRLEILEQRLLLVQPRGNALHEGARRTACGALAAEFLGGAPQPRRGGNQGIVVEEQAVARPQHIALQRGLIEDQRIDRTQPPLVQRRIRGRAAQKEIGQHQQQAEDDQRQPAGQAAHRRGSAWSVTGRPR